VRVPRSLAGRRAVGAARRAPAGAGYRHPDHGHHAHYRERRQPALAVNPHAAGLATSLPRGGHQLRIVRRRGFIRARFIELGRADVELAQRRK